MAALPETDLAWLRLFIEFNAWKEAVTFKGGDSEHEYIVGTRAHPDLQEQLTTFQNLIWAYGHIETYHRHAPKPYLIVDGIKYWFIDNGPSDWVLNRSHFPDRQYGHQWASDTRSDRQPTHWDWDALTWDQNRPATSDSVIQELEEIGKQFERILDVGCGTGRLLDHIDIHPKRYGGLDPSSGMLNQHVVKHPKHRVRCQTAAEYLGAEHKPWDAMLVLYCDELSTEEWELLEAEPGELIILPL